jgi:hypothetical protein
MNGQAAAYSNFRRIRGSVTLPCKGAHAVIKSSRQPFDNAGDSASGVRILTGDSSWPRELEVMPRQSRRRPVCHRLDVLDERVHIQSHHDQISHLSGPRPARRLRRFPRIFPLGNHKVAPHRTQHRPGKRRSCCRKLIEETQEWNGKPARSMFGAQRVATSPPAAPTSPASSGRHSPAPGDPLHRSTLL